MGGHSQLLSLQTTDLGSDSLKDTWLSQYVQLPTTVSLESRAPLSVVVGVLGVVTIEVVIIVVAELEHAVIESCADSCTTIQGRLYNLC